MFSDSHTCTNTNIWLHALEPSALRSSVKLVGLVSWHGPVFNRSEVGPLGRTLGCFSKPVCGMFGIIVLLENPIVSEVEVFYSIHSVQCASVDAASTVFDRWYRVLHFEGLRSLSHLDFKVCATANMSLAWRSVLDQGLLSMVTRWDSTVVGIKMLVGHNLHWRRVVFNISNTSNLMKFNIWCKICFTDTLFLIAATTS